MPFSFLNVYISGAFSITRSRHVLLLRNKRSTLMLALRTTTAGLTGLGSNDPCKRSGDSVSHEAKKSEFLTLLSCVPTSAGFKDP